MKVPFLDLKQQYNKISEEVKSVINEVCENTSFIGGPQVSKFEKEFASYCHTKYSSSLNSGTDALKFALLGAGIKPGDEVITVPNTFIATTEVVTQIGAKLVFVDIDEKTYNIDVSKIESAITSKTKAIIPVHLYGQCADMDPILEIAKAHNLVVIEDACQAHGAFYKGRISGSMADAAAFSFYPGKNLGAYGDGGALTTDRLEILEMSNKLKNHGQKEKYYHEMEGYNSRLDSIQAGVLSIKLKFIDGWNESRRQNALYYNELLKDVSGVITPFEPEWSKAVYHLYILRVNDRAKLQDELGKAGVSTGLHYPLSLHLQEAYKFLGHKEGDFPVTERVTKEIISLPMFPELTKEQIEFVVENIRKIV